MKSHHEISIPYETLVRFLESAEGNYRNALYIRCSACRYHREEHCGDFLFIPGHDCVPILFPLADAMDVIGHIDPSDCAGNPIQHRLSAPLSPMADSPDKYG